MKEKILPLTEIIKAFSPKIQITQCYDIVFSLLSFVLFFKSEFFINCKLTLLQICFMGQFYADQQFFFK